MAFLSVLSIFMHANEKSHEYFESVPEKQVGIGQKTALWRSSSSTIFQKNFCALWPHSSDIKKFEISVRMTFHLL